MAQPVKSMILGLVSNAARLIEVNTSPAAGVPPQPQHTFTLNFFDYADLNGIQARIYFKETDPYLQIWLVQYQGYHPGQPIMLPQQPDEPLSIDGTPIANLGPMPAMVMFADDSTPDARISILRTCPHLPPPPSIAPYDHNTHLACNAVSQTNQDWYEVMPA